MEARGHSNLVTGREDRSILDLAGVLKSPETHMGRGFEVLSKSAASAAGQPAASIARGADHGPRLGKENQMVSATQYAALKTKNLATLAKVGSSYAVEWKKFDPSTGEELTPEVTAVGLDQVEAEITAKTAELAALNTLKADMQALG
jgi:hypothetical protein